MTVGQCYDKYKGTSVLVPGGGVGNDGQCLQWWDAVHHEVYGHNYIYTPGAIDLAMNFAELGLMAGYELLPVTAGMMLHIGDSPVYDARIGSKFGHVDIVSREGTLSDFYAYDTNWGGRAFTDPQTGYPILHEVHHNDGNNNYIMAVLRPIGGSGGDTVSDLITSTDNGLVRILQSEIGGWDYNGVHTGVYDKQLLAAWQGHEVRDMITELFDGGADFRNRRTIAMAGYEPAMALIDQLKQQIKDGVDKAMIADLQAVINKYS